MRRRLRILIVLASTFAMVLVLNVGTAFADNTGDPTSWTCEVYDLEIAPGVFACGDDQADIIETGGTAVSDRTLGPIFNLPSVAGGMNGLFAGIDNNPFCLIHVNPPASP